jgi:hypothetical protein
MLTLFWHVTPCGLSGSYQCFGGNFCLHLHGWRLNWAWNEWYNPPSSLLDSYEQFRVHMLPLSSGYKTKTKLEKYCWHRWEITVGSCHYQASRWLPSAAAQFRAQVRSCGICGGQSGAGAGFLLVLWLPLPILIPPTVPHSSSIVRDWCNSSNYGRRTKWIQVSSHPKKLKKDWCIFGCDTVSENTAASIFKVGV